MSRSLVFLAVWFLLLPSQHVAQVPAAGGAPGQIAPQRSNIQKPQTGTATIRGRVLASSGAVLDKARVMVLNADNPQSSWTAPTDAAGRYEVAGLPFERYRIVADRSGYLQGAYGRTRANQALPPPAFDVADGATIAQADIVIRADTGGARSRHLGTRCSSSRAAGAGRASPRTPNARHRAAASDRHGAHPWPGCSVGRHVGASARAAHAGGDRQRTVPAFHYHRR